MFVLKRALPVVAVLSACALAACSKDSLSPDSVDASTLSASVSGMTSTFQNNAAFQSMATLSALFPQYAATAAVRATLPMDPAVPGSLAARADVARKAIASLASISSGVQALFPANVLGKTLVWDTLTHTYQPDPTLAGAPAAGIRILIYAVNPVTSMPVVPLQQLGYLELTDKSSPQDNKLGVLLTLGQTTIAAYDITAVTGLTSGSVGADGYIQNPTGTGRVDFGFHVSLSLAGLNVSVRLDGSDGAAITATASAAGSTATVSVGVSKGGNAIEIEVSGDQTVAGVVKYNGTTVATITGDNAAPLFTGANGRTLKPSEVTALTAIFTGALEIASSLADVVFAPGNIVFH
jgi:hypothetical protein